jgi:hypothetical protein
LTQEAAAESWLAIVEKAEQGGGSHNETQECLGSTLSQNGYGNGVITINWIIIRVFIFFLSRNFKFENINDINIFLLQIEYC